MIESSASIILSNLLRHLLRAALSESQLPLQPVTFSSHKQLGLFLK